jgi:hypothetical protein
VTASKRVAVGTTAAGVAACAVCCAAPVAAVAAGVVFAPVAGVAGVTALAITVAQRRHADGLDERNVQVSSTTKRSLAGRKVLAGLLLLAAALFVVGVAREHSLHHSDTHHADARPMAVAVETAHEEGGDPDTHPNETTTPKTPTRVHRDAKTRAGEATTPKAPTTAKSDADNHAGEGATPETPTETHGENTSEGRVLGLDIETWPLVIAFAAVSVALAIALLRSQRRTVVVATALIAGVAAVFDIAEIAHQAKESQALLIVIAAAVTAMHLTAVIVAALILNTETSRRPADNALHVSAS